MRRAAIIFNPTSARLPRLRELVARHERDFGWAPTAWVATTDSGPADHLVDGLPGDIELVIAAGGDGTVRAVGAALAGRALTFGIVPVGTANLLARNLHLPLGRLGASVAIAFSGDSTPLDLAVIDYTLASGEQRNRPYFVMAGFGVDSDMVAGTKPAAKERHGWLAYVLPILRSLGRIPVDTVSFSVDDGAEHTATVHSFLVANGGTITAGLRLVPDARLDDGELDLVAFRSLRGRDRWSVVRWLGPTNLRMPHRDVRDPAAITASRARVVTVTLDSPAVMQADGDLLGSVTSARFSVLPGALNVHVARSSRRSGQIAPLKQRDLSGTARRR